MLNIYAHQKIFAPEIYSLQKYPSPPFPHTPPKNFIIQSEYSISKINFCKHLSLFKKLLLERHFKQVNLNDFKMIIRCYEYLKNKLRKKEI